jgi:hypothetical protein
MEKLSSDLLESKIAALDAFLACLEKYDSEQLEKHFKDVWNSCKQVSGHTVYDLRPCDNQCCQTNNELEISIIGTDI